MTLIRLIYASSLSSDFNIQELEKIQKKASETNKLNNITGILVFGNDLFLQCLEGSRGAVNILYNKIIQDKRHHSIILLQCNEIAKRDFGSWAMKFILLTEANQECLLKYSTSKEFNPYVMSAESSYQYLLNIAKNREAQERSSRNSGSHGTNLS